MSKEESDYYAALIFFHASESTSLEALNNLRACKFEEAVLFEKSGIYDANDQEKILLRINDLFAKILDYRAAQEDADKYDVHGEEEDGFDHIVESNKLSGEKTEEEKKEEEEVKEEEKQEDEEEELMIFEDKEKVEAEEKKEEEFIILEDKEKMVAEANFGGPIKEIGENGVPIADIEF